MNTFSGALCSRRPNHCGSEPRAVHVQDRRRGPVRQHRDLVDLGRIESERDVFVVAASRQLFEAAAAAAAATAPPPQTAEEVQQLGSGGRGRRRGHQAGAGLRRVNEHERIYVRIEGTTMKKKKKTRPGLLQRVRRDCDRRT